MFRCQEGLWGPCESCVPRVKTTVLHRPCKRKTVPCYKWSLEDVPV